MEQHWHDPEYLGFFRQVGNKGFISLPRDDEINFPVSPLAAVCLSPSSPASYHFSSSITKLVTGSLPSLQSHFHIQR